MTDHPRKKRLFKAVRRAASILIRSNYSVTFLQGEVFNIEATREREIRKIRVVIDQVAQEDERIISALRLPMICTKEIWCKKPYDSDFTIKEVQ